MGRWVTSCRRWWNRGIPGGQVIDAGGVIQKYEDGLLGRKASFPERPAHTEAEAGGVTRNVTTLSVQNTRYLQFY